MKAALYRGTGPSSVLSVEEIATPGPGPGQVRVKVFFSGVNPTDWKTRSGATGGAPASFQVPHHDGSGAIDALGEGVTDRALGQRVWIYQAAYANRYGTAAEYCVVPAARTIPLPDSASYELGACLGVPALTGGAGAVGHFAIELAKHAGALVATTVSSEDKAEMARAAGADLAVNYREPGATELLKSFAPRMDRIVELALGANLDLDLAVSGPGTLIVVYAAEPSDPVLPTRRLMNANVMFRFVLLYSVPASELAEAVAWANGALVTGALTALPVHLFPLDDIAAAQDAVEHGAVGKVLVVPDRHI